MKKITYLLTLGLLVLTTISCEIGLGAQVDTTRPKIEITYPPKGSIVKGTFILAGKVSDDVGVTSMNVTLTSKDTSISVKLPEYSLKDKTVNINTPAKGWRNGTTWQAEIGKKTDGIAEYNGWDLPDGDYFVDVTVSDGYGSVSDRRSITIDNSAPVFIAENLRTKGSSSNPDVFGQKINLTGKVKDDNEISKVNFTAYDENQALLLSSSVDYSMTSDGIVLAQYYENEPNKETNPLGWALGENFNFIYGRSYLDPTPTEVKDRYFKIGLEDSAREFKNPIYDYDKYNKEHSITDDSTQAYGTGTGNISEEIYLKTQEFNLQGITVDDLNEYKKGDPCASGLESKLTVLASSSIALSGDSVSDFSEIAKLTINPDINPKWYVKNYEYNKERNDYNSAFIGAPLTVVFEKGNGTDKFRPSNIRVVLAKLKESVPNSQIFDEVTASDSDLRTAETSTADVIVLNNYGKLSSDLTNKTQVTFDLSDPNLQTPNRYQIMVFGHDGSGETGMSFEPKEADKYGFKASKNAQPPVVKFLAASGGKDSSGNALPKSDSWIGPKLETIPFYFTVTTDGEELADKPRVYVKGNGLDLIENGYYTVDDLDNSGLSYSTITQEGKEKKEYTFKWSLKKNSAKTLQEDAEFDFAITVVPEDKAGSSIDALFNLNMDNKNPEITIEKATPYIEYKGTEEAVVSTVNGEFTVPLSFSDDHALNTDTKAKIYVNNTYVKESAAGTVSIDTTSYDKQIIIVKAEVTDKEGNTGSLEKKYYVDQDTDTPVFTFTNLYTDVELSADTSKTNNFGLNSNNMLSGSVEDDDGIGTISVRVKAKGGSYGEYKTVSTGNKTQINYNFKVGGLITADGEYTVQFKVVDSAGKAKGTAESEDFNILVDGTAPEFDDAVTVKSAEAGSSTFAVVEKNGTNYYIKNKNKVTVTVKPVDTNLKSVKANGGELTPDANGLVTYTWTPASDEVSGEKEIKFVAEDKVGNTKEKTVTLFYDAELPVVSDVTVSPNPVTVNSVNYYNGNITFKGNISDNNYVKSVILTVKDKNDKQITSPDFGSVSSFTWQVATRELANGEITLNVVVTDRAGNKNETSAYKYNIDQSTDKPVISIDEKETYGITRDNLITGTVTDDDGMDVLTITVVDASGNKVAGTNVYSTISGKTSFSCNLNKDLGLTKSGNYKLKLVATDSTAKTGLSEANTSEKVIDVEVDGLAPIINNIKVGDTVYYYNDSSNSANNVSLNETFISGTKNITFTVEELHLKYVKIGNTYYGTKPAEETGTQKALPTPSGIVYTITHSFSTTTEGANKVSILAVDNSGDQDQKDLVIKYDSTKPTITDPTVTPKTKDGSVNGIITISGIVSDNDKVNDDQITVTLKAGSNPVNISDAGKIGTLTITNQHYTITGLNTAAITGSVNGYYKGNLTLTVNAKDRAGNVADTKTYVIPVDQSKDAPVITPVGFTENVTSANVKEGTNLYNLGSTLKVNISDDDGFADGYKPTVQYKKNGEGSWTSVASSDLTFANNVLEWKLPSGAANEGKYQIQITVQDKQKETDYADNKSNPFTTWIGLTAGTPVLSIKTADSVYVKNSTGVTVKGTFQGGATTTFSRKVTGTNVTDGSSALTQPGKDFTTKDFTDTVKSSCSEGTNQTVTVTYTAENTFGQKDEKSYTYYLDNTKPVISSFTVNGAAQDNNKWYGAKSFDLAGTWTDKGSGVASISYWINPANDAAPATGNFVIEQGADADQVSFAQTLAGFNEGSNTLWIVPVDGAGNEGEKETYTLKADISAPAMTDVTLKESPEDENELEVVNHTYYIKGTTLSDEGVAICGNVQDTLSGLASEKCITVYEVNGKDEKEIAFLNKDQKNLETNDPLIDSDGNFALTIPGSEFSKTNGAYNLKYNIRVVAKDDVGNETTENLILFVDSAAPVVSNLSVTKLIDETFVNGDIVIKGNVSDNEDTVNETIVKVAGNGKTHTQNLSETIKAPFVSAGTNSLTQFTFKLDTTNTTYFADNKEYTVTVESNDRVGNSTTSGNTIKFTVKQSTDVPSITFSNLDAAATAYKTNLFGDTKWDVIGTAYDDDGVAKVEVYKGETKIAEKAWTETDQKTQVDFTIALPSDKVALGDNDLTFKVIDNDKAKSSKTPVKIAVDNERPVFSSYEFYMKNGDAYETTPTAWSDPMFATKEHKIKFTVSDDTGFDTTGAVLEYKNGTSWDTTDIALDTAASTNVRAVYVHTKNAGGNKTDWENEYRVTDKYGRQNEISIKYNVDNEYPDLGAFAVQGVESTGWIRADNVTVTAGKDAVKDSNLSKTVTYAITGTSSDSGSFDVEVDETTNPHQLKNDFSNSFALGDGTFNVAYTFSDVAGNKETKTITGIKVDNTAPLYKDLKLCDEDDTELSDGAINSEKIKVGFKANDVTSGLSKALVGRSSGFAEGDALKSITFSSTENKPSQTYVERTTDAFDISKWGAGTHNVYLRLVDIAGNASSPDILVGSFLLDKEAPVVTIDDITGLDQDADESGVQVNGTITLTGKATDDHWTVGTLPVLKIDDVEPASGVVKDSTFDTTSSVWSIEIDTMEISKEVARNKKLTVEFKDQAGNESSAEVTLDVDQYTACPIVIFDEVDPDPASAIPLRSTEISGLVKNNNGVKEMYYIIGDDKFVFGGAGETRWTKLTDEQLNTTSGVWRINPDNLSDGSYTLYLKIVDNQNSAKTFFTGNSLKLGRIRLRKGAGAIQYEPVNFSLDMQEPQFDAVKPVEISFDNGANWKNLGKGVYYGGPDMSSAKIRVNAKDTITKDDDLEYSLTLSIKKNPVTNAKGINTFAIDFSDLHEDTDEYNNETGKYEEKTEQYNGNILLTFLVADETGRPAKKSYNISVDNIGPDNIFNVTPSSTQELTGNVVLKGNVSDNEGGSGLRIGEGKTKMYYAIPEYTSGTRPSDPVSLSSDKWIEAGTDLVRTSINSWTLTLKNLATNSAQINSKYAGYTTDRDGIYSIPVWFKIIDEIGNVGYNKDTSILYNPNADRPTLKITYPTMDDNGRVTLGGKISITGTVYDIEGISGVYIQYDINGDGKFDDKDKDWLKGKDYDVVDTIPTLTSGTWGVKVTNTNTTWRGTFDAKVLSEWLKANNISLEYDNPKGNTKTLNFRVIAVDNDSTTKLASIWSDTYSISVNNSVPIFSQFKVVQKNDSETVIQELDYQEGMDISGYNWYLVGSVEDNNGIASVNYVSQGTLNGAAPASHKESETVEGVEDGKINLTIPIVPQGSAITSLSLKVEATDKDTSGAKTSDVSFDINIDNTAPAFKDGTDEDTLVAFIDKYGIDNNNLTNTVIRNSNGWATISSKAFDEGSGFTKAVIYLERQFKKEGPNKGKKALYNIAAEKDSNANRTFVNDGITVGTDGIPVYTVSSSGITHITGESSVTVTSGIDAGNYTSYIRKGSLVRVTEKNANKIELVSYKEIASVSGKTVTFTEAISNSITKLEFICGFVVDGDDETRDEGGDKDGDGIVEYMSKAGDNTTWEVSFKSERIPDGPVNFHVVLFDKVGNVRHSYVTTSISNNAPRLARVTLGTDLNGNGTFEDSEKQLFQALDSFEGKTAEQLKEVYDDALPAWDLDIYQNGADPNWKLKDKLMVKPEFVGGEAPFYYVFSKEEGTGSDKNLTINNAESGTNLSSVTGKSGVQGKFGKDESFEIPKANLGENGDYDAATSTPGKNTFRFSFWDSAEEATPGEDSNSAVLNIAMVQDLVDGTAPKAVIHPFFWKGKDPSKNSVKWSNGEALGHIELESDLSPKLSSDYGPDPKVSGQIVVRGTAYDENRLKSLTFAFDNITMENCVSNYSNGAWSNPENATQGWKIVVNDTQISQEGHWVEWSLYVDTAKVTNFVGLNKKVTVTANDGTNESTPGSSVTAYTTVYATAEQAERGIFYKSGTDARAEDETKLAEVDIAHVPAQFNRVLAAEGTKAAVYEYKYGSTGKYQMDILPYIYEVKTELSALKVLNPSVYDRTSLGHYPVRAAAKNRTADKTYTTTGETITLYGFNITDSGSDTVAVTDDSVSGVYSYKVTAGGVDYPVLNNINNSDAKGSLAGTLTPSDYEEYAYNRCPNGETNNLLTDDIEFDVWDINDCAVLPVNGVIEGSKMKINPNNRLIQYAGTFGILYVGMGRGDVSIKNVKKNKDTYLNTSIGFHIDAAGNTYSVNYCGQEYDSYNFMSSRWNEGQQIGMDCFNQDDKILKGRFLSPSMATSSDSARVYLAFYDAFNDQIRFKAGTFDNNNGTAKAFDQFNNNYSTGKASYDTAIKYVQVIAGHNAKEAGGSVITDSNGTARNAGQYVSIVCVPGKKLNQAGTAEGNTDCDVICAVWYDATLNKLMYSFKRDPISTLYSGAGNVTADGWSPAQVVFDNGGEYCQIVADKQGHLHMAAYGGNGDVLYAYLDRYNTAFSTTTDGTTTKNLKTCVVDSFESVGENLTLDVALDSRNRPVPYIGYYNGQKPKYAKLYYSSTDTTTKTAPAGVDDNGLYTGDWDITVIPTNSQMRIDMNERINVGVWKNGNGVLINSTKADGTVGNSTWTRSAGSSSSATVYGNGSNNGVVSYQIRNALGTTASCLETAQKR